MIYASGAAGPPGYGGVSEDAVGEQMLLEGRPSEDNVPGYDRGPKGKSELGNPPSALEKPLDTDSIGVPVDQTE